MYLKYQILNKFQTTTATTVLVSGNTNSFNSNYKSIILPISTTYHPVDYGDDVEDIISQEITKAKNKPFDAETIRYVYKNITSNDLYINFRFWDSTASTYTNSYQASDITTEDIQKNKNGFRKSYFRLYFYDSNSGETNNLIFTEDLDVDYTTKPSLKLNRLYWLRNDEFFKKENKDRVIYMDARFFNAKTGIIKRFINIPISVTTSPIKIIDYSNPINRGWRYSPIQIGNPKNYNGQYYFYPSVCPSCGANTNTVITLSEFIIQ